MRANNQWLILSVFIILVFASFFLVNVDGHRHHGHGHPNGHHGHGHGVQNRTQCHEAQHFLNQWLPQSSLGVAFQTVCRQVGVSQAWGLLQNLLGVTVTGALDQTTFQALLNNANPTLLGQQLLNLVGVSG